MASDKGNHAKSQQQDVGFLEEGLEAFPEEQRKVLSRMMISTVQMRNTSPEAEIASKISGQQLDKILENNAEETRLYFNDRKQTKWFSFAAFGVAIVFLTVLVIMLRSTPDVLEKIIYAVGGVIAGAFGGYGYGKSKGNNQD